MTALPSRRDLAAILAERGPIRKIGVVGMGYVGVPSAVLFASLPQYSKVIGFQRNSKTSGHKIDLLNQGINPFAGEEPGLSALLGEVVSKGKFSCSPDFSQCSHLDAVTIAIQTPFLSPRDLEPDLAPLFDGLKMVGRNMGKGALVSLESTVTPGTTVGIAREILEAESGMAAGEDFALVHAPERVMVGRLIRNLQEHDRIVGGIDEVSSRRGTELYSSILTKGRVIPMSATAAEVEKTAENAFRDLQIAAANQLALYCEAMQVNFFDVREGIASLREEGVTRAILWPGAGVGGHCLTKDSYHLERGASGRNIHLDFPKRVNSLFQSARQINDFMPRHMWHLLSEGLARIGKVPVGVKIAILGWAFIPDSGDFRNTPSELLWSLARDSGARVKVHDPYVGGYAGVHISHDLEGVIQDADAIAIVTAHQMYRALTPESVLNLSGVPHPVLVDGRNILDPSRFIAQGFVYKGVGRGDQNHHLIEDRRIT
jgi:UDP-N-acetyl-D-mannosaminuronic acid dehydrogenase